MPRRSILSPAERDSLFSFPDSHDELIRHYTFSEAELSLIGQHRGAANRLGFAVQLCYMRYPGIVLTAGEEPQPALLQFVAGQLGVAATLWTDYAKRDQTRREHLLELQAALRLRQLAVADYRPAVLALVDLAVQTDKGLVLAQALVEYLRRRAILLPGANVIERICAEAVTRATRRIHDVLTASLSDDHRKRLDQLLKRRDDGRMTWLAWLRLPPGKASSRQMLKHIDRLKILHAIDLPAGLDRTVHRNRLLKIAREGAQMTPHDLAKFETQRRHATLVAIVVEATATVTDEIVDLHDRIMGRRKDSCGNAYHRPPSLATPGTDGTLDLPLNDG